MAVEEVEPQRGASGKSPEAEAVREQIEEVKAGFALLGTQPGLDYFRHILDSEEFKDLSEAEQKIFRVEMGLTEKETSVTQENEDKVSESPSEKPEQKKERRKPIRRKFLGYTIESGKDGDAVISEAFEEWDNVQQTYVPRPKKETGIVIPSTVIDRIGADAALRMQVEAFCGNARHDLDNPKREDRKGMALVYDRLDDKDAHPNPKWYWYLNGERFDGKDFEDINGKPISVGWEDLPQEMRDIVIEKPNAFHKDKTYLKLLGPRIQQVRERIISAELAKRFASPEASVAKDDITEIKKDVDQAPAVDTTPKPVAPRPTMIIPERKKLVVAETKGELDGKESDIATVRGSLAMIKNMREDFPDMPVSFSDVEATPEYQRLPDATRRALLAEVGAEPAPEEVPASTVDVAEGHKEEAPTEKVTSETAEPVQWDELLPIVEATMDFLRETYAPTAGEDDAELLEQRVRDGAVKLISSQFMKQGRELDPKLLAHAIAGEAIPREQGLSDEKSDTLMEARFRTAFEDGLRAATDDKERTRAVLDLFRIARSDDPLVKEAAAAVIAEVGEGVFGDAGVDAYMRAEFFDAHPHLSIERSIPKDASVAFMVDSGYTLETAMEDAVRDALDGIAPEERSKAHDRLVKSVAKRFVASVKNGPTANLAYDTKAGTFTLLDIDRFGRELRGVYGRIIKADL